MHTASNIQEITYVQHKGACICYTPLFCKVVSLCRCLSQRRPPCQAPFLKKMIYGLRPIGFMHILTPKLNGRPSNDWRSGRRRSGSRQSSNWLPNGVAICMMLASTIVQAAEESLLLRRDQPVRQDWCREYTYMRYWPSLYIRTPALPIPQKKPRFQLRIKGRHSKTHRLALNMAIDAWNSAFSGHPLVGLGNTSVHSTIQFNMGSGEEYWNGLATPGPQGHLYYMSPVTIEINRSLNNRPFHVLLSTVIHEIGHGLGLKHIAAASSIMQASQDTYWRHLYRQLYPFIYARERRNIPSTKFDGTPLIGIHKKVDHFFLSPCRRESDPTLCPANTVFDTNRIEHYQDLLNEYTRPSSIDELALTCLYHDNDHQASL